MESCKYVKYLGSSSLWFEYKCIISSLKVIEVSRTETQKERADNIKSKFKKVYYGNSRDMLFLRWAILVFTYPGIRYKAFNHLYGGELLEPRLKLNLFKGYNRLGKNVPFNPEKWQESLSVSPLALGWEKWLPCICNHGLSLT